jgi:CheY-like chemotaxis protein/two-component sensor histidine kinase
MASIGQLATGIAHELKNLLAGIRGYAEIGREGELDAARAFAKIVAVTERASRLTDGLLAFSRKARPRVEPVDLDRLVDDVLDLALTKKARRGIRVSREVEDGLPRALCDANQIEQVLLNLVLNALEAMRTTGGGALRIRLARAGGDMVEVSVADTGPGIAPEVQARIFEPFFTTKAGFGPGRVAGTGLGLSVSRGIVEQHGGTIEVESAPGAGARFTVRLPAAPGVAPPAPAAPAAAPAAASRPRSSARVLVADDEAVIRDVIRRVLRKAGCEVKTARSIGRARKLLSAGPFDLLFLDLVIPGMRGFATLRKLKRRYPGLRVVVVTGQALGEDALAKVREITDGYIEKPFPLAEIIDAVEQAVAPA